MSEHTMTDNLPPLQRERAAFEAWLMDSENADEINLEKLRAGDRVFDECAVKEIEAMWLAWQARAAIGEGVMRLSVLADSYRAERDSLREVNANLLNSMTHLMRGYVNLLESGRDKIISHGGTCDPVNVMVEKSPYLKAARAAIASAEQAQKGTP